MGSKWGNEKRRPRRGLHRRRSVRRSVVAGRTVRIGRTVSGVSAGAAAEASDAWTASTVIDTGVGMVAGGGSGAPTRAVSVRPRPRRTGRSAQAALTSRRRRLGTFLMLAGLVLFGLAYGLPAFRLWQANRKIDATRREIEYARLQQQELLKELERWNDPEVISRVAREQLGLVQPGEMRFVEALPVDPDDPFRVEKRPNAERPLD